VRLLLESGALCERDTFQGERCLYNALNDRIRNLLLSYDYSKSTDPLQPLAAHLTSLLSRDHPRTSDITLIAEDVQWHLHKFVLSSRSPYFSRKLKQAPETQNWRLPNSVPSQSFETTIRYLYLSEVSADLGDGDKEKDILTGIDKLSKTLEVDRLFESLLESGDRRLSRQRHTDEVARGQRQLEQWFKENLLGNKIIIDTERANEMRWDRNNSIFADVLLRADEDDGPDEPHETNGSVAPTPAVRQTEGLLNVIPIGPSRRSRSPSRVRRKKCTLFPAHRAMLIRSGFFETMFSSSFREAQETPYLQIIPVDCSPVVLETILTFLYTEKADFGLDIAVDVLFAADLLFIDKLKHRAAVIISTLGNGVHSVVESDNPRGELHGEDEIDIYEVVRAGWDTRVHRLEEFGARFLADRLERYIDEPDFKELVQESAARIRARQETDTVELIDDIRYYLSERFRLRFEDAGLEEMMEEDEFPDVIPTGNFVDGIPEGEVEVQANAGGAQDFLGPKDELLNPVIMTLDGEVAGDEFAQDAMNYQILLGKIDRLLEELKLDA